MQKSRSQSRKIAANKLEREGEKLYKIMESLRKELLFNQEEENESSLIEKNRSSGNSKNASSLQIKEQQDSVMTGSDKVTAAVKSSTQMGQKK